MSKKIDREETLRRMRAAFSADEMENAEEPNLCDLDDRDILQYFGVMLALADNGTVFDLSDIEDEIKRRAALYTTEMLLEAGLMVFEEGEANA